MGEISVQYFSQQYSLVIENKINFPTMHSKFSVPNSQTLFKKKSSDPRFAVGFILERQWTHVLKQRDRCDLPITRGVSLPEPSAFVHRRLVSLLLLFLTLSTYEHYQSFLQLRMVSDLQPFNRSCSFRWLHDSRTVMTVMIVLRLRKFLRSEYNSQLWYKQLDRQVNNDFWHLLTLCFILLSTDCYCRLILE